MSFHSRVAFHSHSHIPLPPSPSPAGRSLRLVLQSNTQCMQTRPCALMEQQSLSLVWATCCEGVTGTAGACSGDSTGYRTTIIHTATGTWRESCRSLVKGGRLRGATRRTRMVSFMGSGAGSWGCCSCLVGLVCQSGQSGQSGLSGLSGLSRDGAWFSWWVRWVANLVPPFPFPPARVFLAAKGPVMMTVTVLYHPRRCWPHPPWISRAAPGS